MYSYKDNRNFQVILTLDVYRKTSSVGVTYDDSVVFMDDFNHVTSIKNSDKALVMNVDGEEKLKVIFYKQIRVELL